MCSLIYKCHFLCWNVLMYFWLNFLSLFFLMRSFRETDNSSGLSQKGIYCVFLWNLACCKASILQGALCARTTWLSGSAEALWGVVAHYVFVLLRLTESKISYAGWKTSFSLFLDEMHLKTKILFFLLLQKKVQVNMYRLLFQLFYCLTFQTTPFRKWIPMFLVCVLKSWW